MTTLGFEEDTRISKQEIAETQLVEAINLFLASKYLCAITLAGAAEEVLARLLNQQGEISMVEQSFQSIQHIKEKTGLSVMSGKQKNEIFNEWNSARNMLKHHGKTDDKTVVINLFDEAYWMIRRGLANAEKLDISINNRLDFENWIIRQHQHVMFNHGANCINKVSYSLNVFEEYFEERKCQRIKIVANIF